MTSKTIKLPAASSGGDAHKNLYFLNPVKGVKLLSVRWENGTVKFEGQENELDLKSKPGKKIHIRYKVFDVPQKISVWIEYKSKLQASFYQQYKTKSFRPPRVALLLNSVKKNSGEHFVAWDGRDDTKDDRLLLPGHYKVVVEGVVYPFDHRDDTMIEIANPRAYNFGIHYKKPTKKGSYWESSQKEIVHAKNKQQNLSDHSSYDSFHYLDSTAYKASRLIPSMAIFYFAGHGSSSSIVLHSRKGTWFKRRYNSDLDIYESGDEGKAPHANLQYFWKKDKRSFKDLLLVMLDGCNTGNEIKEVQMRFRWFNPKTTSGVHNSDSQDALRFYQIYHAIKPKEGEINQATIKWFGLSGQSVSKRELTRTIQKKLISYYPGKADGKMDSQFRRALKNYQRDHPTLTETGEVDAETIEALKIRGKPDKARFLTPINIAQAFTFLGADVTIGFQHSIAFYLAEQWGIKFWDELSSGKGINTAAQNAVAKIDHRKRKECAFNLYTQKGVSREMSILPARFGKST